MAHTSTHTTGLQAWKITANKTPRSDIYVQMRQIILMAVIFQQAPENLFRIWNNWVWLKCGETLKFSINKITQSNDSRCCIL